MRCSGYSYNPSIQSHNSPRFDPKLKWIGMPRF
ncbi:nop53 (60S ribosomal biogenesis) [Caudoviricetes sp.]|nr:nop53 (60S ribosomal biogenesis) [Caudoviricetes sp.]